MCYITLFSFFPLSLSIFFPSPLYAHSPLTQLRPFIFTAIFCSFLMQPSCLLLFFSTWYTYKMEPAGTQIVYFVSVALCPVTDFCYNILGRILKVMFCIYLRTNSDLCHLQHKLIGFYNPDEKCLQRGTD